MSLISLTKTPPRTFLHDAGLRATANRIAVFEALREGKRPMHHAEVAQSITDQA